MVGAGLWAVGAAQDGLGPQGGAAAKRILDEAPTWIVGAGGLLAFLGLSLLWLQGRALEQPLDRIDAGMHEVLGGNLDYVFPADLPHDRAAGLAQNLNLMMAALLGKPGPSGRRKGHLE